VKKIALTLTATLGFLIGMVAAAVVIHYYYPNIGTISQASLTLYLNNKLYTNNTAINWTELNGGSLDPGYTYTVENMTVVNTGNTPLTVYIVTEGLPADWTLSWQANDTLLNPSEQVSGWLNLTIPDTATDWPTWGFHLYGDDGS